MSLAVIILLAAIYASGCVITWPKLARLWVDQTWRAYPLIGPWKFDYAMAGLFATYGCGFWPIFVPCYWVYRSGWLRQRREL